MGHSPKAAQAQAKTPEATALQLGVALLGPAPVSDTPLPYVCWAPGTSAAKIAAYNARRIDGGIPSSIASPFRVFGGRWSRTATNGGGLGQGDPTTITYSIVPDGLAIRNNPTDTSETGTPSNLRARLTAIYGSEATWLALFARVGQALSAQTGLNYVYEPVDDGAAFGPQSAGELGKRGDVRISGIAIDGNSGILAYNYGPDFSDMVIDTSDSFFTNTSNDSLGFRNTVTHEFGHGLGLDHTCPINESKLMEPFVSYNFDGPQFDDVSGLQYFYGDPSEKVNAARNNDTTATATPLSATALPDGKITRDTLSIDGTADVDYFRFTAPANKSVSISVRPAGTPYLEGPQNNDGTCTAGSTLDPRAISDLGFELLTTNADGTVVSVSTTNAGGVGSTETLAPTNLNGTGPFYIRVFGSGVNNAQRYSLDTTIGAAVITPTPAPTSTTAPTPTPGPTAVPTATPTPAPTGIRPIVDLNGRNPDGSTGQDSPVANGIDNVTNYFYRYRVNGTVVGQGGAQLITPAQTLVISDISAGNNGVTPGEPIREARVELTPDVLSGCGQGTAPDNCNPPNKRDNEVLGFPQYARDSLAARGSGISVAYDVAQQVLTFRGGTGNLNFDRGNYEYALRNVTYENKLPIVGNNQGFDRDPQETDPNGEDRVITYTVDTDNDASNNVDSRFDPQEGTGSNPKQSRVAVLTLRYVEVPSLVVTTLEDSTTADPLDDIDARTDRLTSLREAIRYANTLPNSETTSVITFADNVRGDIELNNPLPVINPTTGNAAPIEIQGPGARLLNVTSVDNSFGIFRTQRTVTISGLSISGGSAVADTTGGIAYGGGIYNQGTLTVTACTIANNSAQLGGGIANVGGRATISLSTISGNSSSSNGGGVYSATINTGNAGFTNISNSTISGNTGGSGVYVNSGTTTLSLATITNNSTAGVTVGTGTNAGANVTGTVISGNAANNDVARSSGTTGGFTSNGYNLIGAGNRAGAFNATGDRTGFTGNTARLGALGDNGGNTDTHALFLGSPAIDMGNPNPTNAPENDQRGVGFARVVNTRIDIGAFERQDNNPVTNVVITPRNPQTNDTLTANANSDTTNLNYRWTRNGVEVQNGPSNTLDLSQPGFGSRGDTIAVEVTATNASGVTNSSDSVVVANTAPTFTLAISPAAPTTNQTVSVTPTSSDADGDTLTYTYQWKVNGANLPGETRSTLDLSKAGNGDRDQTVSIEVNGNDGASTTTNTASVVVANSAPVARDVAFSVRPGQTVTILLQANDPDTADTFTFNIVTAPTQGTATPGMQDGRSVLTYTANANATGTDSLTFTATDNNTAPTGATSNSRTSSPAKATITISGTPSPTPTPGPSPTAGPTPTPRPTTVPSPTPIPNRPPAVNNTSLNTTREVPVSKTLAASDPDASDVYSNLTLRRVSGPRKGTGEIRKDTDGNWKLFYKASGLYQGNDEVQFVAVDTKGAVSNVGTITINLFNTAPTARSTQMQVAAGGSADVGIFGQDVDRDALTFKSVGGPSKGTGEFRKDANGNTRFFYQNSQVAVGDDEVRFVAIDTSGKPSAVATLTIKVIGVFNRAPVANNVSGTTTRNTPVAVAVSASDPDDANLPAGQTTPLTYKRVGGPSNGTGDIQLDNDGVFKMFYTPRAGFVGTETIRYVAIDDKGRPSAPATITITVTSGSNTIRSGSSPSANSS